MANHDNLWFEGSEFLASVVMEDGTTKHGVMVTVLSAGVIKVDGVIPIYYTPGRWHSVIPFG